MLYNPIDMVCVPEEGESTYNFCRNVVQFLDESNRIHVNCKIDNVHFVCINTDTADDLVSRYTMLFEAECKNMEEYNLKRNGSGYFDPTAYEAIKKADAAIDNDGDRRRKLIGCIYRVCELAGFHVEERLVLKDLKTGKVWR